MTALFRCVQGSLLFMKTYKNLYPKICDWDNLYEAYRKARKGKRSRPPAAAFEYHQEQNLVELVHDLRDKRYEPGSYHSFYIHEPKRRLISAAPFRDRVVHHALCNVIEPIFEMRSRGGMARIGAGQYHEPLLRAVSPGLRQPRVRRGRDDWEIRLWIQATPTPVIPPLPYLRIVVNQLF